MNYPLIQRPEFIVCIRHTHGDLSRQTWCGRHVSGFLFQDIDHAVYNECAQGRLLPCPECVSAISKLLEEAKFKAVEEIASFKPEKSGPPDKSSA